MHQSLQMVTRVHFTLSTATHNNSQWIRSPLAVPANSLLSINDTVHPKLCGKCTMNTQLALEASNQISINSGTVSPHCCIQRVLKALGFPNKNYRWHLTAWRSNIGPLPLFLCLCYLPLWIQIHQTAGLRLLLPNVQSLPALCELLSPRFVSHPLSTQTCPFIIPLANTCLSHGSISARYTADAPFPIY